MPGNLIATHGNENWVLSPDGAFIYVAGNDGYLTVYDAHSGQSVYAVDLGTDLGAISLSPDGTRLAVVEDVPDNTQQYQDWTANTAIASFYVVDLSTFSADKHTYQRSGTGYTFADVTWTDNDTLQLSQNILPGYSGWAPLATVELSSGVMTEHSSYYSGLGTSASLLTIPGSDTVLLGQLGLSSAEYFLIGPDGTSIRSNGVYANNVYGYAGGIEAASGTTVNDRIIIVTGGGAHLYDGTMTYIGNLASLYPNLGSAAGVTFSEEGQRLFFLDATNKALVVIDAYNLSLVATVPLTGVDFQSLQWGEEIVVAPDGKGVYFNTQTGISYVAVDLPGLGTNGADQLSGTAGNDIIDGRDGADLLYGLAGNDWLIGGSGDDRLEGGDGFDVAAYETATSAVTVDLRIAGPQATGGADSDTLVGIEGLSGSVFNDTLIGNAAANLLLGYDGNDILYGLDGDDDLYGEKGDDQLFGGAGVDWLFGEAGADWLDGGTGADRLEGGDGNDTYVIDDAGDIIIETATGGYDTMRVINLSTTIASGVEALIIQSGAVNATGNLAANNLTGSDEANVLSGLGGNDTLNGLGGNDTLIGGAGADTLTGGAGADTFRGTAAELNGDMITDFTAEDRIVISDANANANFTFSVSGGIVTYSGGSFSLGSGFSGNLFATTVQGGGIELRAVETKLTSYGLTDFNGDGIADVLWRSNTGVITTWLGQADGTFFDNSANTGQAIPLDWNIVGTGDYNGDGLGDLMWRSDAGVMTQWLGQLDGTFRDNFAKTGQVIPLDWNVIGTGDFNGDGLGDLIWRSDAGVITEWLGNLDGSFRDNFAGTGQHIPLNWTIDGMGDFNGDGLEDLIWRSDAGVITEWLGQNDGSFKDNFAGTGQTIPTNWQIVGVGDFNADGYADILWQSTAGTLTNWLGNPDGSFTDNFVNTGQVIPQGWELVGVGDLNGDGRDDILWRTGPDSVETWFGQDNGGFTGGSSGTLAAAHAASAGTNGDLFYLG
ncbi:FG-GAP-like repeat-containing protein [Sphingomonas sinipercae]|nr:FG-GAP-like repeat-containing protein [Sphingomonas sinipercae]